MCHGHPARRGNPAVWCLTHVRMSKAAFEGNQRRQGSPQSMQHFAPRHSLCLLVAAVLCHEILVCVLRELLENVPCLYSRWCLSPKERV